MGLNLAASLTQVLAIDDISQVGYARRVVQKLAEQHGFNPADAGRAALVATELASNLLKHAERGELHLRVWPHGAGHGLELLAVDRAQGFDVHACLADGFSTGGTQGIGLGAVSRLAQVFDVHADERGAVVLARLYREGATAPDLRIGVSQHSLHDDPACGDTWHVALGERRLSALVVDGLGHGEEAERAAKAGAQAFALSPFSEPASLLGELHYAMSGTRGGAAAIAQYDADADRLAFIGIGNIGATLVGGERPRGLASHPGIVGGQYRKGQVFDYAHVKGNLLILFSDGLQSRWSLQTYPGLALRHPAIIATVLHRDFCRGRDDVTVLVIDLESAHA
ncbi:Serine/threonine-protein kinase RsbT [Pseudomonas reidholzensis]|uniref:Serine/threonine-protein kinase RsbT n=1 Tax=Pseudomonas reidholzensis TaxID=1785162 RepID=A0A383RTY7_9PSED|nr:ATP-binding protein [Pseudomonas reidholzensis]SYX90134.1 Serine/threonine-protein kinase RsbT [Pseudomonas reidholzensis]